MKFTLKRETLLRPLQSVTGVVERRQTLPVLANLLIEADATGVSLTGTDLEVEMVARCDVSVDVEGSATIPARKLADIWRALPDDSDVTVSVEGDKAVVRSGRSRFSLATLPATDFPRFEGGDTEVSVEIAQQSLRSSIDRVAFAMAQQDVRVFLNGMLLEIGTDYLRTVATDGHRLAMNSVACAVSLGSQESKQAIVPRKAVMELGRLLDDENQDVKLLLGTNHLRVTKGPFTLTTKLVDGQFPDYQKVVPRDTSRTLIGDKESLRNGFQCASILSNEKYRGVRLLISPDQLVMQANNPEQEEAEETVAVSFNGDELEIGFNVSYLLDVLNAIDSDTIKLKVSDANSSALIESQDDDEALYVVMPMRL